MKQSNRRPTVEQLAASPEMGLLAVLEHVLDVAIVSLAAACPELHCLDLVPDCDQSRAAFDILLRARDLGSAINRYRLALASAERRQAELPF